MGIAVTAVTAGLPSVPFAYRNPSLHIALNAADAVIALVAAYLVFGRFRQNRSLGDLAVVYSLGIFAGTNLLLSSVPDATLGDRGEVFSAWAPAISRLIGAAAFAVGAVRLPRLARAGRQHGFAVVAAIAVTLVAVGATVFVAASALPAAVRLESASASGSPRLEGHAALLVAQALGFVCFAVASVGFTRRAVGTDDELLRWFGAGAALSAIARVNYLFYPSLYTDFVYVGDVFRLAFYVYLLIGAAREVSGYWRTRMEAAVLEERRRIARDLHDGVAQELVFIGNQGRRLRGRSDGKMKEGLDQMVHAAERGVGDARRAIAALSRTGTETLDEALVEVAEELTRRAGLALHLDLARIDVPAGTQEELVRIVREAITNASRHTTATNIWITLGRTEGERIRLRVTDDGGGFDPSSRPEARVGFGLVSMRERTDAMGAELVLRSEFGRGTTVEVVLPSAMP